MFRQFSSQRFVWITCLIIMVLVLSACSKESSDAPQIDPTQGVQLLAGVYATQIMSADLPQDQQNDEDLNSVLGTWKIILTEDGKFTAEQNGQENYSGVYGVQDNKIVIGIQSVCADCACDENIGRYFWQLNGNELSFRTDYDLCSAEEFLLTAKPLKRAP